MILADKDIKEAVKVGRIVIQPKPNWERQLGSCSLDLRLGKSQKNIILKPGEFCLGITYEYIELPDDLCGLLHGRSSLGRKGLMIHSTAPLIDAGFAGRIVLELYNAGPEAIKLKSGMRICAVSFEKLSSPAEVPYYKKKRAKFLGQRKP